MIKNSNLYFGFIALVCIIGLGIDMMDIDAAQYASISREMMQSENFLQLYDAGVNYLDKPPFLFWVSSISLKLFGVNNFAYKLPSFLFAILAVYAVFKFSLLYYQKKVSQLAAIVLASCQGYFLMTHDVRTDTILMGTVIFSIWQLAEWYRNHKIKNFILGCIGIAVGMMTKGPIALFVPLFGFFTHFILQRNYKQFAKKEYLLGILIIALLLLPMSWGLYQQYDLHPEKWVNDQQNVSGLKFYFWTQSFGRITSASSWNNNANIFFLLQNMLWSFLPWIIFFLIALIISAKKIIKNGFRINQNEEAITIGGFVLTYLSLGMSKYQLPHYIFVAFPFAAIITAQFINELINSDKYNKWFKPLLYFHIFVFTLLWILLIILLFWTFESTGFVVKILSIISFILFIVQCWKWKNVKSILLTSCLFTSIGLNLFLNSSFYPSLLKYQAGSNAGKWIKAHHLPPQKIFSYQYTTWRSLNFYSNGIIYKKDTLTSIKSGDIIITSKNKLPDFTKSNLPYELIHEGDDYPVTKLTLNFLNPDHRSSVVNKFILIKIK